MALDLAGRGRLRYCMLVRAVGERKPGSAEHETSKLVFRFPLTVPDVGFTGIPEDFGVLPNVAELPVRGEDGAAGFL